ncbi:hypothetical protein Tsubulata_034364 [Turnera subulata]|uniref:Uncharacterized protein n=1 Tax=Turnera subulata TaxID=218843 RepID=A0A9Q0FSS5_9ROSI|nr:hypothetical protein Tsubulata_034364 [Turnera subulata]
MSNHDDEDPWLAPDKLYHFLFCLLLTLFFSKLASVSRHPFLRRHSLRVGSIISLSAGAAKEAADQFGLFLSAGASARDAFADLLGVLVAALSLSACRGVELVGWVGFLCKEMDCLGAEKARE